MEHASVNARVNGRDMKMEIPRDELPLFEGHMGCGAYDVLRTFTAGRWRIEDIRKVLEFAAGGGPAGMERSVLKASVMKNELFAGLKSRTFARLEGSPKGTTKANIEHIRSTLETRAPARYAVLAQQVLSAALFGVGDDEAEFTDERNVVEP